MRCRARGRGGAEPDGQPIAFLRKSFRGKRTGRSDKTVRPVPGHPDIRTFLKEMSCLSGHVRVSEDGLPWETVRPATPRTFFKKLFCPGFTLPQQETADGVIEKDRPHQFANVPW